MNSLGEGHAETPAQFLAAFKAEFTRINPTIDNQNKLLKIKMAPNQTLHAFANQVYNAAMKYNRQMDELELIGHIMRSVLPQYESELKKMPYINFETFKKNLKTLDDIYFTGKVPVSPNSDPEVINIIRTNLITSPEMQSLTNQLSQSTLNPTSTSTTDTNGTSDVGTLTKALENTNKKLVTMCNLINKTKFKPKFREGNNTSPVQSSALVPVARTQTSFNRNAQGALITCNFCRKPGHKANVCRQKIRQNQMAPRATPTCVYCKRPGHLLVECWIRPQNRSPAPSYNRPQATSNISRSCYECGGPHFRNRCPQLQRGQTNRRQTQPSIQYPSETQNNNNYSRSDNRYRSEN